MASSRNSLVPRTRSSHTASGKDGCELRVQSGTRNYRVATVLRFRSSHLCVPQALANFGIGTLASKAGKTERDSADDEERARWRSGDRRLPGAGESPLRVRP